ncbi:hypothetical protein QTP88_019422 [Uroleucon formosanum]
MPPKCDCQKRKEKIKNDLKLKKIRGSLDKFILPKTNFGMDGNFQQNKDSIITELMTLNSLQKECSDIAMNDTDLPFSTKNENILLSSDSSENLNTVSLLDPVHALSVDRLCFKDQVLKGPYQPILDIYPSTIQGNKRRSFQKNCSTSLLNFLNGKSIDCVLDNAKEVSLSKKAEERIKNRQIMNRLIDIVICLCKGGRPFRGHNESSTSNNQGLFKEILNLLSKPIETFVSLKRMTSVTAESIFNTLCDFLILIKKNWESVIAVCFDGASTMAGSINGVQMRCKEQNNEIMYVHCYAHCLNLTLIDAVCEKNSKKVVKNRLIFYFLGTIQYVHNYIESSPMRHSTLEKVSKETGVTLLTLKSCSITRWACRVEAVKAIKNNYNVLITAIDEICENTSVPEMRAKGIGISQQLQTFEFMFGMELMSPILNIILKELFNIDINALKSEMIVVKNCVLRSSIELQIYFDKIKEVVQSEIYPNLYTLLKVALSIPVNSATCERSFSNMRRFKNWLRTSMYQERFSSLAIINIERDVSNQLKAEDILIEYAKTNKRFQL